ncbi:sigma factor-like helix-turn-helix DNA-binding protein [uncultured Alistipes sp.]|uniref:sigma factor-like helix-turn-helix DNA-binding protein n=1 Tax=uncultured Alistipes sp. TaxID=538949 RepID=UPI0020658944|nr:sigma factor-like helix-turn-helix DNA-binding protein [uncultured Alistipes sp.]DAM14244.1 MAG TPA: Sigma factor AlgU negative regulatory factor, TRANSCRIPTION.96A [Caudoviricetes sp.]
MNDDRQTQFHLIEEEYTASKGVFDEDDARVRRCKDALRRLSGVDRRLFILYAESGSVRKMSQMLGVSKSTVQNRVTEIRRKIIGSMSQAQNDRENE